MTSDDHLPARDGVAPDTPSAARIYDFLLGGGHNFAVDREVGAELLRVAPHAPESARANRAVLRRGVLAMIDAGVRQFLDIGSGLPTVGNVHEVAQHADPGARVVYVDNEPIAVAHSTLLLDAAGLADQHAVVQADFRDPQNLLEQVKATGTLDFSQPVGLLLVAVLHFVGPDQQPHRHLAHLLDALAPGSMLLISHATTDGVPETMTRVADRASELYAHTRTPVHLRTRAELLALFDGVELLPPGVVWAPQWPDPGDLSVWADRDPAESMVLAGMGRVTGHRSRPTPP